MSFAPKHIVATQAVGEPLGFGIGDTASLARITPIYPTKTIVSDGKRRRSSDVTTAAAAQQVETKKARVEEPAVEINDTAWSNIDGDSETTEDERYSPAADTTNISTLGVAHEATQGTDALKRLLPTKLAANMKGRWRGWATLDRDVSLLNKRDFIESEGEIVVATDGLASETRHLHYDVWILKQQPVGKRPVVPSDDIAWQLEEHMVMADIMKRCEDTTSTVYIVLASHDLNDTMRCQLLARAIRDFANSPPTFLPWFVNRNVEAFDLVAAYLDNLVSKSSGFLISKPAWFFSTQYSGTGKTAFGLHLPAILSRKLDRVQQQTVIEELHGAHNSFAVPLVLGEDMLLLRSLVSDEPKQLLVEFFTAKYAPSLGKDRVESLLKGLCSTRPILLDLDDSCEVAQSAPCCWTVAAAQLLLPSARIADYAEIGFDCVLTQLVCDHFPYIIIFDDVHRMKKMGFDVQKLMNSLTWITEHSNVLAYAAGTWVSPSLLVPHISRCEVRYIDFRPLSADDVHGMLNIQWGERCFHKQLSEHIRNVTGGHARSCAISIKCSGVQHAVDFSEAASCVKCCKKLQKNFLKSNFFVWDKCFGSTRNVERQEVLKNLRLLLSAAVVWGTELRDWTIIGTCFNNEGFAQHMRLLPTLRSLPLLYTRTANSHFRVSVSDWQAKLLRQIAGEDVKEITAFTVEQHFTVLKATKGVARVALFREAFIAALEVRSVVHRLSAVSGVKTFPAASIFPFLHMLSGGRYKGGRCTSLVRKRYSQSVKAAFVSLDTDEDTATTKAFGEDTFSSNERVADYDSHTRLSSSGVMLNVRNEAVERVCKVFLPLSSGVTEVFDVNALKQHLGSLPLRSTGELATSEDAVLVVYALQWDDGLHTLAEPHKQVVLTPGVYFIHNSGGFMNLQEVNVDASTSTITYAPSTTEVLVADGCLITVPNRCTVVLVRPVVGSVGWQALFGPSIDAHFPEATSAVWCSK